jgi:hypothetical protein
MSSSLQRASGLLGASARGLVSGTINLALTLPLSIACVVQTLLRRSPVAASDALTLSLASWAQGFLMLALFIILPILAMYAQAVPAAAAEILMYVHWSAVLAVVLAALAYAHWLPFTFRAGDKPVVRGSVLGLESRSRFSWSNPFDLALLLVDVCLVPYSLYGLGLTAFVPATAITGNATLAAAVNVTTTTTTTTADALTLLGLSLDIVKPQTAAVGALWFNAPSYAGFALAAALCVLYALCVAAYHGSPETGLESLPEFFSKSLLPRGFVPILGAQLVAAAHDTTGRFSLATRTLCAITAAWMASTTLVADAQERPAATVRSSLRRPPVQAVALSAGSMLATFLCVLAGLTGHTLVQAGVAAMFILVSLVYVEAAWPAAQEAVPFVAHLSRTVSWLTLCLVVAAGLLAPTSGARLAWGMGGLVSACVLAVRVVLAGRFLLAEHAAAKLAQGAPTTDTLFAEESADVKRGAAAATTLFACLVPDVSAWRGMRRITADAARLCMVGSVGSDRTGVVYMGSADTTPRPVQGAVTGNGFWTFEHPRAAQPLGAAATVTRPCGVAGDAAALTLVGSAVFAGAAGVHKGFIFQGAAADLKQSAGYRALEVHPGATYTFAHDVAGRLAVGATDKAHTSAPSADTAPSFAFLYDIVANKYVGDAVFPGSESNAAYGVWHNGGSKYTLCGGYATTGANSFAQEAALGGAFPKGAPVGSGWIADLDYVFDEKRGTALVTWSNWTAYKHTAAGGAALKSQIEGISSTDGGATYQLVVRTDAGSSWVTLRRTRTGFEGVEAAPVPAGATAVCGKFVAGRHASGGGFQAAAGATAV